jgi:hypothetical protein
VRPRLLAVPAAIVLACTGLSACRTNVGVAARVNGETITESKVASYVTPKAKPVHVQSSSGSTIDVGPLTFVLQTIVEEKFFAAVLAVTPIGLSQAAIDNEQQQDLRGQSPDQVAVKAGLGGYTKKFRALWLRSRILYTLLSNQVNNGYNIVPALQKTKFKVSVNPRYGSWDAKQLFFDVDPSAGLPPVLQPSGATASP